MKGFRALFFPLSITFIVLISTVSFASVLCHGDDDEYDVMHPQLHILRETITNRRFKRDMPPVYFQSPDDERNTKYWNNVAQDILKTQLNKNRLNTNIAKNIILFLGDGMSIPTLTAARIALGGEEQKLSFEKYPYVGLSKTYCANTQVADSACSATAYLGGVKGNYATIGVTANVKLNDCAAENDTSNHVHSIARWAQNMGMATGLITTTQVTHASPAGVYAHTANRNWESDARLIRDGGDPAYCTDIAKQLIQNPVGHNLKVIMGGGRQELLPDSVLDSFGHRGKRKDGKNLIDQWKQDHADYSAAYIETRDQLLELPTDTEYVLGLFNYTHLPFHVDADNVTTPTLTEMVSKALDIFQRNYQRYFLFVEGGRIDHGHHSTQAIKAIDETVEFQKAIDMARTRTNEEDTLIVVTADHSHTMSVAGYSSRKNNIFGINNGQYAGDKLPYATLSYANGPGYDRNMRPNQGRRKNLLEVNMADKDYKFPSGVPLDSETHGGDDVAVFASGPWAHLFSGAYEQNFIPHAMGYAACIGDGLTACSTTK